MKYAVFSPAQGIHIFVNEKEAAMQQRLDLFEKYDRLIEEYTICEIIEHENGDATWTQLNLGV